MNMRHEYALVWLFVSLVLVFLGLLVVAAAVAVAILSFFGSPAI